ncbi:MAG: tetratricopeptide repeat protein [Phycisphaerae bacterium]
MASNSRVGDPKPEVASGTGKTGAIRVPEHSRYGRWRAGTLLLVYVLMAAHVLHWKIAGRTLAPLELNEVMYTFELGIVTAGFLFMLLVAIGTMVFGRFFCSWGCHILALQDLCSWLLKKLRVRPKAIRSRLLVWVPMMAMLYMFVWPQAVRIWEGRSVPMMHLTTDAEGWASFTTQHFWRNLPGPGIIIATFLVCGFVVVYVLGSRGFCTYGCPYGAIFGLLDRLAPGRIRVGDDCIQCGTCTAVCSSNIRVHEEVNRYGTVVNPACMKDLDCVSACPQQTLRYGFGKPSLVQVAIGDATVRKHYDFTVVEELIMGAVFLVLLVIFRGLYDTLPFLLSIGLAGIGAYGTIVAMRLIRLPAVKFNRWQLKARDRLRPAGWWFSALALVCLAATVHSGVVRYHYLFGRRYYRSAMADHPSRSVDLDRAVAHLEAVDQLGIVPTRSAVRMLAELAFRSQRWAAAQRHTRRLASWHPNDAALQARLAKALANGGDTASARDHYLTALKLNPARAETHFALAGLYFDMDKRGDAIRSLRETLRLQPDHARAHYELGAILIERQDFPAGIQHLKQAIELQNDYGDAHYNLAVALAMSGNLEDALAEIEIARRIQPDDEKTAQFERFLHDRAAAQP